MDFKNIFKMTGTGLLGGSLVLLITINIFNALNYFFHFAMARMLNPTNYGTLVALMSLIYILGVSTEAIQTVIAKYVSKEKSIGKIKNIINKSLKKGMIASTILFILFLLVAIFISNFLGIEYPLVALTGLVIFSVILLPINRGVLQGKKKFKSLGFNMVFEAFIKIFLAILLVYLGWKVYGAILAVWLGMFLAFILSFSDLKEIFLSKEKKSKTPGIYHYSLPVFVVMITIITFYSLDVLLAKRFFSGEIAGQYAIASTLSKIIFFGTLPISKAMFPISSEASKKGKNSKDILWKSSIILGALILMVLTIVYFFPDLLIKIFSGAGYPLSSKILLNLFIAMSLLSFTNLIFLYKLSLGKLSNYFLIPLFLLLEVVFLWLFHGSLMQYSITLIFLNTIFLISSIIFFKSK